MRFQAGAPRERTRHPEDIVCDTPAATPFDLARRLPRLLASDVGPETAYGDPVVRPLADPRRARLPHRGLAKFCPICRQGIGAYRPFGLGRRRNAVCPACGSLERHRFLWLYLERMVRLPFRRLSVLHIAPERCIRRRITALPRLRYTSIDLYRPDALRRMDAARLDFPGGRFDLVICSHVLEHVEDDWAALREIARVLRPSGRAVIVVPLDLGRRLTHEDVSARSTADRLRAFGHPYHVRTCGADYGERIAAAGFSVRRIDSAAFSGHRRRYHRLNKASLFDCRPLPALP